MFTDELAKRLAEIYWQQVKHVSLTSVSVIRGHIAKELYQANNKLEK